MLFVQLAICYYLTSFIHEAKAQPSWNDTDCTHIVTPNGTCLDSSSIPCNTLNNYVQNSSVSFVSNTVFCFLSGIHVLNVMNLKINSVSNISLIGFGASVQSSVTDKANQFNFSTKCPQEDNITFLEPTAIIKCKGFSGFVFTDIVNLLLANLTILNCGANVTETLSYMQSTMSISSITLVHYVAVLLINVSNLHIEATSIQNSTGYGLMGINVLGQSQISGSSFVGNNQFVKSNLQLYDQPPYLCALYVCNSRCTSKDEYAGGNAIFIYKAELSHSTEPILDISSSLFALGVDGSIGFASNLLTTNYNSMGTGLGVLLLQTSYKVRITITNTVAHRNQASYGGNLNFQVNPLSFDVILSKVNSTKGISEYGGSLYFFVDLSSYPTVSNNYDQLMVSNSIFSTGYNTAQDIFIPTSGWNFSIQFQQCNLAATFVLKSLCSQVTSQPVIFNSSVFSAGGLVGHLEAYYATIKVSNCTFSQYNLYASESNVYVADSVFSNSAVSALQLDSSHLSLTGNVTFISNAVQGDGGALYLSYTDLTLSAPAYITFINNTALNHGGAIFIRKKTRERQCPIIFNDPKGTLVNPGVNLYFEGSYANVAGDVLYGGDIDVCSYDCKQTPNYLLCSSAVGYLKTVLNATFSCNHSSCANSVTSQSMISSDVQQFCSCTNSTFDCQSVGVKSVVYPGQTIDIPIVTRGQLNGISPDTLLISNLTYPSLTGEQYQTMPYCSKYQYQIHTKESVSSFICFFSKSAYLDGNILAYCVKLNIFPCPVRYGFIWTQTSQTCTCVAVLKKYDVQCNINTLTISKRGALWVGNSSSQVLAVHQHCPCGYCKPTDMTFSLDNQDEQCNLNRGGILCGGCKTNFSSAFGSAQCKLCSHQYIWVLVTIACLAAVMVALLFLLNCTVTTGTINCVILYANVVGPGILNVIPDHFRDGHLEKFLFVFIAWLNLDLGIETCFYDGMDTYAKTWLELLFPLYILALVGAIIIGSRWSSKLAWLSKRNAVPVLATLILLSYTNCLQIVIEIFSYTQLDTGNASDFNPPVWLPDGNIMYARGKHVYLLIAGSIVTVTFIVPYTALLLLSPWLQARSHLKYFLWVNKLKPFIDAYQAPFKDRHRYWPGVHLMIRVVLYVVFTTNQANDIHINLLTIAVASCLYSVTTNIFSVYKKQFLRVLESFILINLMFLSASLLYIHNNDFTGDDFHAITISTGIVFCAFVGIVIFHFSMLLKDLLKVFTLHEGVAVQQQLQDVSEVSPLLDYDMNFREPLIDISRVY